MISLQDVLSKHQVIICVGSGGVGKTTLAASLGIAAAQQGLRVLVMTIDPAKRLRVALGLEADNGSTVKVPGQSYKGELSCTILNAEKIFADFITQAANSRETAQRLLKNRLYQQLSTTLSGSQEFTALLHLSKVVGGANYDLIILDTPPAQHAIDFLEAPEKLHSLFQEGIVRWFVGDEEQKGFVRRWLSKGTRTVFSALEMITGNQFMHELNDFFTSVKTVQQKIEQKTSEVEQLLKSPATGFVLVTGFDIVKLKEAEKLHDYLVQKSHNHMATLINRAYLPEICDIAGLSEVPSTTAMARLQTAHRQWFDYHASREKIYSEFIKQNITRASGKIPVVRIPEMNDDILGLKGLEEVARELDLAFQRTAY